MEGSRHGTSEAKPRPRQRAVPVLATAAVTVSLAAVMVFAWTRMGVGRGEAGSVARGAAVAGVAASPAPVEVVPLPPEPDEPAAPTSGAEPAPTVEPGGSASTSSRRHAGAHPHWPSAALLDDPVPTPAPVAPASAPAVAAAPSVPSPASLADDASAAITRGDHAAALQLCETALRQDSRHFASLRACALASCRLGLADEARTYLARLPEQVQATLASRCPVASQPVEHLGPTD